MLLTLCLAASFWVAASAASPPSDLASRWKVFHAAHPNGNARDASEALNTTEAQLLATEVGPDVVLLRSDTSDLRRIFAQSASFGRVTSVTRNDYGISERTAVLESQRDLAHVGNPEVLYAGEPLHLHFLWKNWKYLFSVIHYYGPKRTPVRSLQAFDAYGTSINKFILEGQRHNDAFDRMTREFRAPVQPTTLSVRTASAATDSPPNESVEQLCTALRATADFLAVELLLEKLPRAHQKLWQEWGSNAAYAVSPESVQLLAKRLVQDKEPATVAIGNLGLVQLFSGAFDRAQFIGEGWFSYQAKDLALHIHAPDIARGWVVRLGSRQGDITIVEFFDTAGNLAARFMDAQPPGTTESTTWRAIVGSLPRVLRAESTSSNAAAKY
ncbi:ChuX/HutX family heme-like substrate-binding protein [Pollutimonas bauzanensis]|uniref:Putative hemin transport protein n=1 Tax=Pollutimonas bauzanensis TaxID=658167 RepID=A0A1M5W2G3_9BURK|nr:ChuX/HutX family heme-like substrate-binding protein [Pollutimonas bauzanensis]SHH81651.1 putative hemin transport protein [Pollutimonas bauzanensis]